MSESKTLLQEREAWERQLLLVTKRLDEETVLGHEKDKALKELDAALLLAREELARQRSAARAERGRGRETAQAQRRARDPSAGEERAAARVDSGDEWRRRWENGAPVTGAVG